MATLYKKRGRWFIEYTIGGSRKTRDSKLEATEANKVKAEKLKREIEGLIQVQKDSYKPLSSMMLDQVTLDKAIRVYKDIYILGRSHSHVENFEYVLKRFKTIVPGGISVREIRSEHIARFAMEMRSSLSKATQVTYFQYLASFFAYLKENGFIELIPIGKGVRPKKAMKNIICFDPLDLDKIFKEAKLRNEKYYLAFKLFLLTGQRPGDVLKLQIRDIDFHRKILYFRVHKTSNEFKFPIYGKLEQFLRDEMKISEMSERDSLLFPDLTVLGAGEAFRKIKKVLGFTKPQYYTLKTFRKSFATEISRMGMTIQEVQALLDHKSTSTTLRYYADVKAEELKNKIDSLLK